MKIRMKDEGFDYEANKTMILSEMKDGYTELQGSSAEELEEMIRNDARWKDIFLDKLFGRIVEYDPDASLVQE